MLQVKKTGMLFLVMFILLTAGAGIAQTSAMDLATVRTTVTDQFQPEWGGLFVDDDQLKGTVLVDEQRGDDIILSFEGKANEQNGQLPLIRAGEASDAVTDISYAKKEIDTAEGTAAIDAKRITFAIPLKQLPVAAGTYFVQAGDGTGQAAFGTRLYTKAVVIEIPVSQSVFPGTISLTKTGAVQITIHSAAVEDDARFYLVVVDEDDEEVKRIAFRPERPTISANDLTLPAGNYTMYLEMDSKDNEVDSNRITFVVPVANKLEPIPNGKDFPGKILLKEDGSIQLTLTMTSPYEQAVFYLLVLNEEEQVVKRIKLTSDSSRLRLDQYALRAGTYELVLEMVLNGETYRSTPVKWKASGTATGTFPIASGQAFPGGILLNGNGTISIAVDWQDSYSGYTVYLLVYDFAGDLLKRIPHDLDKPNVSIKDLSKITGGYTVLIEIADPQSGLSARSVPVFVPVNTSKHIVVFINGQLQTFSKPPIEINGRTLVPLRAIFEALGAKVDWDEATQTVTATKDNNTIKLTIGSKIAYKNGEKIYLDVPAQLLNGDTTMVPIRFVSEALGAKVGWDAYTQSVLITQ
ncbi:stalk domain-containing protein [Brevibacillus fulvus]|uniref:Copper amine oxidase-like N-terminal domain-containing protein n=1 Tax=Brevibacillus fulvus TaxID=1125967 RepID=A0A938XVW9_9BACL|nr:hypothetical protein [Brevibacillus fulvus]